MLSTIVSRALNDSDVGVNKLCTENAFFMVLIRLEFNLILSKIDYKIIYFG